MKTRTKLLFAAGAASLIAVAIGWAVLTASSDNRDTELATGRRALCQDLSIPRTYVPNLTVPSGDGMAATLTELASELDSDASRLALADESPTLVAQVTALSVATEKLEVSMRAVNSEDQATVTTLNARASEWGVATRELLRSTGEEGYCT